MKKYFVKHPRDFFNEYSLVYTTDSEQEEAAISEGYERCTRAQAFELCRAEIRRRESDPMFSGYADALIFPYDASQDEIAHFSMFRGTTHARFTIKDSYLVERIEDTI